MTRHPLDGLDEDIRDHIERETQDNIDRGMTPGDARDAALRRFGNVTLAMERHARASGSRCGSISCCRMRATDCACCGARPASARS